MAVAAPRNQRVVGQPQAAGANAYENMSYRELQKAAALNVPPIRGNLPRETLIALLSRQPLPTAPPIEEEPAVVVEPTKKRWRLRPNTHATTHLYSDDEQAIIALIYHRAPQGERAPEHGAASNWRSIDFVQNANLMCNGPRLFDTLCQVCSGQMSLAAASRVIDDLRRLDYIPER